MEKLKRVFSTKATLCLALSLLLTCAAAAVGVTYARYQWEFTQASYFFTPENRAALTVYGAHLSDAVLDTGSLPATSGTWEPMDGGMEMDFSVANGKPDAFLHQDQQFVIRLAVGLTAGDVANLSVALSYTDGDGNPATVTAKPSPIPAGSFQHSAFGDGWVYRFHVEDEELRFALRGDAFDYWHFTVTVTGTVPATLLDLQVTQTPAA